MLKLVFFPLLLASASALAETPPVYGASDCRIGTLLPAPTGARVTWSGACKDGFAHGPGILAWNDAGDSQRRIEGTLARGAVAGEAKLTWEKDKQHPDVAKVRNSYEGTLRDGRPDGQGFFQYSGGAMYEGGVANGEPHGAGIYIDVDRSRYEGEWVAGKRHGKGKATFGIGGSYDGEWKNDRFDGAGTIVYAGTPRTWQGNFVDGRPAGVAKPVVAAEGSYNVPGKHSDHGARRRSVITATAVPPAASWDQLSPGEQNSIKAAYYPTLAPGDEPPYPLKGVQPTIKLVAEEVMGNIPFEGLVLIYVNVGIDGKPKSARIIGKVSQNMGSFLSAVVMTQPYKPALCQGTPCEMIYPFHFNVTL